MIARVGPLRTGSPLWPRHFPGLRKWNKRAHNQPPHPTRHGGIPPLTMHKTPPTNPIQLLVFLLHQSPPIRNLSLLTHTFIPTSQSLLFQARRKPQHTPKPAKHQWQDEGKSHQPSSQESTPLRDGHVRLNFPDDTQANWEKKIKFALHHKSRMKAACELSEARKPQPLLSTDETQLQAMLDSISNISRDIPEPTAKLAANIIAGAGLLDAVDISRAQVIDLRTTQNQALIIPLPGISRFALPDPFKGRHGYTWALIHGTNALGAQCILLEGFIRPADWTILDLQSRSSTT